MKLCFICKYPPLVGGVSTDTFWKVHLLTHAGVEVDVVTNASEASEVHRFLCSDYPESSQLLKLHYLKHNLKIHYIPHANPFVTRLATLALGVLENNNSDLIEGSYFEPNGIVANLVSGWTGIPYGVKHAGSDIGRLFRLKECHAAYQKMLMNADYLQFSHHNLPSLRKYSWDIKKIYEPYYFLPLKEYYNPDIEPLQINSFLEKIMQTESSNFPSIAIYKQFANKKFYNAIPTIGIYGKASEFKGHFELISAIGKIKELGFEFNLLMIMQGDATYLQKIVSAIEKNKLEDNFFLLPFLACWEIPNFISICTAVCYLENNFPVENHQSIIPSEILSCAKHLIISENVANSFFLKNSLLTSYCSIVNLQNDSLFIALKKIISSPASFILSALECYRKIILPAQKSINHHSQNLANYYENISKHANKSHRLSNFKKIKNELALNSIDGNFDEIDQTIIKMESDLLETHIRKMFSKTASYDKFKFDKILKNFLSFISFKNDTVSLVEDFSKHFCANIGNDNDRRCLFIDLIQYELLLYKIRFIKIEKEVMNSPVFNYHQSLIPCISSNCIIASFHGDIPEKIHKGDISKLFENFHYQSDPKTYIFSYSPVHDQVKIFAINLSTLQLLEQINGTLRLDDVEQIFYEKYCSDKTSVHNIIQFLYNHKLIYFKPNIINTVQIC